MGSFTQSFEIPEKYRSKLRLVEPTDQRSDDEILESLRRHAPITSEKNIWTYWHAGVDAMPGWTQRNVIAWVRLHPEWTIRVLDKIPDSPNFALKWIKPEVLPKAFVEGTMSGKHTGAHSADFLRGAALYEYGGAWMDVGCIVFRSIDKVCWDELEDENSPYTIGTPWCFEQWMANHFVAARKGDLFIKKWHDVFIHVWENRTDFRGVSQSPLFAAFLSDFNFAKVAERGFDIEPAVTFDYLLDYIAQVLVWIRLTWIQEPNGGFDGVEYWRTKIFLLDVKTEAMRAQQIVGFEGQKLFDVFTTRLDADPEGEAYKNAEEVVWTLLSETSWQKITHGSGISKYLHCGTLLDSQENGDADVLPGTFGELLRYGSIHFEQTRETVDYVREVPVPEEKFVIRKGVCEV